MPIDFGKLHSLNGLAALVHQSGDYVDPLNSRAGIQGVGELGDIGAFGVPTLTPGLHGMMRFPGSGGSVDDLANPIHPQNTGLAGLGCGNTICDSCSRNGDGLGALTGAPDTWSILLPSASVLGVFGLPAIPNYVVYAALAYFLFMSGGGGGAHKR